MLKLYKKTLIVCTICAVIGLSLSILCEILQFPHYTFIQNLFVGATCSLLIVIITTMLQYRSEHAKVFGEYSNGLRNLIFWLNAIKCFSENSLNHQQYEHYYSELNKCFSKITRSSAGWFSKKKTNQQKNVYDSYAMMWIGFEGASVDSHKQSVNLLIGHKDYQKLLQAVIDILPDGMDKKFVLMLNGSNY